jgi:hypothetical protein
VRLRNVFLPALGAGVAVAYFGLALPWMRRWGTHGHESRAPLPGDELVEHPAWSMTHAVTIHADPEAVWPWLAQIGYRRGGLYSYDWLDRLFGILDAPSAERILPEFQDLQAGDVIPLGAGPSWPVAAVQPGRLLVLAPDVPGFQISWTFALTSGEPGVTRLVTRVRAAFAPTLGSRFSMLALDPTAFLMTREMLLGIKWRAEQAGAIGFVPANKRRTCNVVDMPLPVNPPA